MVKGKDEADNLKDGMIENIETQGWSRQWKRCQGGLDVRDNKVDVGKDGKDINYKMERMD